MKNKKLTMLILAGLTSICLVSTGCSLFEPNDGSGNQSSATVDATITLSTETLSIVEFATAKLSAEASDGSDIVWSTSDATVVSFTEEADGSIILTGLKVGTATITATSGKASKECVVTVTASAYQPSLVTDYETVELTVGKFATVTASVSFKGQAVNPAPVVTWTVNDSTIASIEDNGDGSVKVTALKPGDAIIKATSEYKGKAVEKSIPVYVSEDIAIAMTSGVSELYVWNGNGKYADLPVTTQLTPVVTIDGEAATDAQITYTTDEDFVTVSADGVVTATKPGEVRITAKYVSASNIEYTAHCDIKVSIPEINLNKTADVFVLAEDGDKVIDLENEIGLDSSLDYQLIDMSTGEELAYTEVNGGIELAVTKANGGVKTVQAIAEGKVTFTFEIAVINKVIKTADELLNLLDYVEKYHEGVSSRDNQPAFAYNAAFVLGNSIDLTGKEIAMKFSYAAWACDDADPNTYGLMGMFDGRGHTLYGGTYSAGGLFGQVGPGSIIKNVAIVNATQTGMSGTLGLTVNGSLENVLVDVVKSEGYNCAPFGPYVSGDDITFKNVVVYYPDNNNQNVYSFAWGGGATTDNVYIISNQPLGSTLTGKYYQYAYGKTCAQIPFEGLSEEYWDLTGERATFKSLNDVWELLLDGVEVTNELKAGQNTTLALPTGATYEVKDISSNLAQSWVSTNGNTIAISTDAYESFTFNVVISLNGATRTVAVSVDASKITINTGINYDFDLSKRENLTYTFDGVTDGTLKVTFGGEEKSYAVTNGSVTIPYADASATLGEVACTLESGKYIYSAQITVVTKVITTADELINLTDYTTKYNEGTSPRDGKIAYAYKGYFVLGGNIDLTGKELARVVSATAWAITPQAGCTTLEYGLIGTFDGRGYTLYGGTYKEGGILGYVGEGSTVKNVAIVNATLAGGMCGVLGTRMDTATIENVLVDVANYTAYNAAPLAVYIGNKSVLRNVVIYCADNTAQNSYSVAWGNTDPMENVYVISDQTSGVTSAGITYYAEGTKCADIPFTSLSEDLWVLTGEKATFKSTEAIVGEYLKTLTIPTEVKAGQSTTLSLPSAVSFTVGNFSNTAAEAWISVENDYTIVISGAATEGFTFDVVLTTIYGASHTVSITVDASKQYVNVGTQAFSLYEKQDTTYNFGEGVHGTFKVTVGDTVAEYEVVNGSVTVPYAHVQNLLGEYQFSMEAGVYVYSGTFIVATKVINTADELINITNYTTKYNEGKSSRDGQEAYAYKGYFVLGGNIDLTGKELARVMSPTAWSITPQTDCSTLEYGLIGTFDGRGYTLYGGTYKEGGIFGWVGEGSTVKNVAVVNATLAGGMCGVFGTNIRTATIENVLVDIVSYTAYNAAPLSVYIGTSSVLRNVVIYCADNTQQNSYSVTWGNTDPMENVYVISDQASGVTSAGITYYAEGTKCADIPFANLSNEYWVLTGDKAIFKSTEEFLK